MCECTGCVRYPFLLCTAALASYSDEVIGAVHCMLADGFVNESEIEFCQNHHLDLITGEPMPCPCDLPLAAQRRTSPSPPRTIADGDLPTRTGEESKEAEGEKDEDASAPESSIGPLPNANIADEDAAASSSAPASAGGDDNATLRPSLGNARIYSTAANITLRTEKPPEMQEEGWRPIPMNPPLGFPPRPQNGVRLAQGSGFSAPTHDDAEPTVQERILTVQAKLRSWAAKSNHSFIPADTTVDCAAPIHAKLPCLASVRPVLPCSSAHRTPTAGSSTSVDDFTADSLRQTLTNATVTAQCLTTVSGAIAAMLYVHCKNVRMNCTPCTNITGMIEEYADSIRHLSNAMHDLTTTCGDELVESVARRPSYSQEGHGEAYATNDAVRRGVNVNEVDEDAMPALNAADAADPDAAVNKEEDHAGDAAADEELGVHDDEDEGILHRRKALRDMLRCMFAFSSPLEDAADMDECPCTDGVAFFNLVNSGAAEVHLSRTSGLWEHEETGDVFANARCKLAFRKTNENKPYRCARTLEAYQAMVHFQSKSVANGDKHKLHPLDLVNRHTRWMTSPFSPAFKAVAPPTQEDERLALLATKCNAGLPMSPDRIPNVRATLSGHQRETLQWMMDREDHPWYMAQIHTKNGVEYVSSVTGLRLSSSLSANKPLCYGIVADEMGLGKTITTLALVAARPASAAWLRTRNCIKATLVVVPVSIGVQWEREAQQFLPNHSFHMIHSTYSKKQTPVDEADIVVVTYETLASRLRKDAPEVSYRFHRVVFDEVQQGCTKSVEKLKARRRWALSGTPPSTDYAFNHVVREMISKDHDMLCWHPTTSSRTKDPAPSKSALPARFHGGLRAFSPALLKAEQRRAFVMRHVKSDPAVVASLDLPPRRTNVVRVVLPGPERRAYAAVEEQTRRDVRGIRRADGQLGAEHVHRLIGWVDRLRRVATEAELAQVQGVFQRQAQFERRAGQVAQQTSVVPAAEAEAALRRDGFKMPEALLEILRALAGDPPEFDECAVCLDGYQRPVVLRCGHVFCHECVTSLSNARGPQNAAQAGRCPLCKELTLDGKKAEIATPSAADAVAALAAANGAAAPAAALDAAAAAEDEAGTPGGKVGAAVRLIASLLEEQGSAKVLVFSVYPQFLTQVHEQLSRRRVRCFEVNGGTTMKKRGELIKAFQDPRDGSRVCLLSSRAGDAGLTLTAANHVVLLEPSLNAAVDAQAIGRVHRFGQRREVTVHRVVVKGTVEERVQALLDQGRLVTTERTIGSAAQAHYTAEAAGQLADIIAQDAL